VASKPPVVPQYPQLTTQRQTRKSTLTSGPNTGVHFTRRREYWMFQLVQSVILFLLWIALNISQNAMLAWFVLAFVLGTLIPSLAVAVRRLHDTNRQDWWLLIAFIPLIGGVALIILFLIDSDRGTNRYGPCPE
jgi:uncharacterized membrane protein YhaH (DUF805 family)